MDVNYKHDIKTNDFCGVIESSFTFLSRILSTIANGGIHQDIEPFSGRSSNLSSRISGMLINPNCEFELNFIPLNTLIDWLPEFNKIKSAIDLQKILKIDHSLEKMSPKEAVLSLIIDEDSQDSISESQTSIASSKIHRMEYDASGTTSDLTLDDIRLLVELFYLPYEHRPNAQQMFIVFYWLRFNYDQNKKLNEWRCRTSVFHTNVKNFNHFVQRLTTIHSRSLLYNVYNYVIDINSTNLFIKSLIKVMIKTVRQYFYCGNVESGLKRGGLVGEFFTSMYALCITVCYQDEIDHLLNQHSEILTD
ncbi:unnamed protein product, partial [Rotaria sordida]